MEKKTFIMAVCEICANYFSSWQIVLWKEGVVYDLISKLLQQYDAILLLYVGYCIIIYFCLNCLCFMKCEMFT